MKQKYVISIIFILFISILAGCSKYDVFTTENNNQNLQQQDEIKESANADVEETIVKDAHYQISNSDITQDQIKLTWLRELYQRTPDFIYNHEKYPIITFKDGTNWFHFKKSEIIEFEDGTKIKYESKEFGKKEGEFGESSIHDIQYLGDQEEVLSTLSRTSFTPTMASEHKLITLLRKKNGNHYMIEAHMDYYYSILSISSEAIIDCHYECEFNFALDKRDFKLWLNSNEIVDIEFKDGKVFVEGADQDYVNDEKVTLNDKEYEVTIVRPGGAGAPRVGFKKKL